MLEWRKRYTFVVLKDAVGRGAEVEKEDGEGGEASNQSLPSKQEVAALLLSLNPWGWFRRQNFPLLRAVRENVGVLRFAL